MNTNRYKVNTPILLSVVTFFHLMAVLRVGVLSYSSQSEVDSWLKNYQKVMKKQPPRRYKKWFEFATNLNCPTDIREYSKIYTDLQKYREKGKPRKSLISPGMLQHMHKLYKSGLLVYFRVSEDFTWDLGGNDGLRWNICGVQKRRSCGTVLSQFYDCAHLLPANLTIFYSPNDEIVSLPADDCSAGFLGGTPKPCAPYDVTTQFLDVFNRSTCFNKTFGGLYRLHGNLYRPNKFLAVPHLLPIFHDETSSCSGDIAFPARFAHKYLVDRQASDQTPWAKKRLVLFWRGSATGTHPSLGGHEALYNHRVRLAQVAEQFNAAMATNKSSSPGRSLVPRMDICVIPQNGSYTNSTCAHASMETHFEHKYLLVVDGHGAADRLIALMQGTSLIFYNSLYSTWVDEHFRPWLHFVPVAFDFSDLGEKLLWAVTHEREAQKMGAATRELARRLYTRNGMKCYTALLWMEYAELYPQYYLRWG